MKRQLILLALGLTFSNGFSQTNTFPPTGNVGVGTTTPSHALTVNGDVKLMDRGMGFAINYATLSETNSGASTILGNNIRAGIANNTVKRFAHSGDPGSFIALNYHHGMTFHTGVMSDLHAEVLPSNEVMRITHGGNVGIGTIPTSKLTVEVDANKRLGIENITSSSIANFTNGGAAITFSRASDGLNRLHGIYSYMDDVGESNLGLSTRGDLVIATGGIGTYDLAPEAMRVKLNGSVGIGTADTKGYKLAVNGKIRSQEIKVEAANWPDYVFAKSYQLPTLQETEKHIKEKGHLPGIPSAAEVNSNGIDLGEMNAKLLQKIEELTLHLIEQHKTIKYLDEQRTNQEVLNQANQTTSALQQKQIDELKEQLRKITNK